MKFAHVHIPTEGQAQFERLVESLQGQDLDDLLNLMAAVCRADQQYRSNKIRDPERRILVGPRLPRWMVDRYRRAAKDQGISLYKWATDALEEHLERGYNDARLRKIKQNTNV